MIGCTYTFFLDQKGGFTLTHKQDDDLFEIHTHTQTQIIRGHR